MRIHSCFKELAITNTSAAVAARGELGDGASCHVTRQTCLADCSEMFQILCICVTELHDECSACTGCEMHVCSDVTCSMRSRIDTDKLCDIELPLLSLEAVQTSR